MTQKRVLILGSSSHELIRAIVAHMDNRDEYDVAVVDSENIRRRRGRGLADILGDLDECMVSLPSFLKLEPDDKKSLYMWCLLALYRELLSTYHRTRTVGAETLLNLLAYIFARDGPAYGDVP